MIAYFFAQLLIGFVVLITSPLSLAPNVSLPSAINTAISSAGGYIAIFYQIIPLTVTALFVYLTTIVAIEAAIFGYKLIRWAYQKIPGIN